MTHWGKIEIGKIGAGIALLSFVALLAGCGGGGGGDSSGGTPAPTLSVSAVAGDGLTATLSENSAAIARGGTVTYTETLKNTTPNTISLTLKTSVVTAPDADLTVTNSAGQVVYSSTQLKAGQSGSGNPPAPPGGTATLAPGQSLTRTLPVTAFVQADSYAASAVFHITESGTTFQQDVTVGPLKVTAS